MALTDREESRFSAALDRLHDWMTRVVALGMVFLVGWGAIRLVLADTREPTKAFVEILEANWKASLFALVVLFYRPLRSFLERLEKVGGMEAPHHQKGATVGVTSDPSAPVAGPTSEPRS